MPSHTTHECVAPRCWPLPWTPGPHPCEHTPVAHVHRCQRNCSVQPLHDSPLRLDLHHNPPLPASIFPPRAHHGTYRNGTAAAGLPAEAHTPPPASATSNEPACYPLTPLELQRSLVYAGDARLRRVVDRARRGLPLKIVVIGGSVAAGSGAGPTGSAHAHFHRWLRARYPRAAISFESLAVGGTTSMWRLANFDAVERAAPFDLVLWDYSSNDLLGAVAAADLLGAVADKLARQLLQECEGKL